MERVCKRCGGVIPPTRAPQARTCSEQCKLRHQAIRWTAANPERRREIGRTSAKTLYHMRNYGRVLSADEMKTRDKYAVARSLGFRSGLEVQLSEQLEEQGFNAKEIFESLVISYTEPETVHKYTPDFPLPNGIVIESKGRFVSADRKKHTLIKAQHPDIDLRFVFSNSRTRISKQSKTTYAAWSQYKGFLFADKFIPQAWLDEPANLRSLAAIRQLKEKK